MMAWKQRNLVGVAAVLVVSSAAAVGCARVTSSDGVPLQDAGTVVSSSEGQAAPSPGDTSVELPSLVRAPKKKESQALREFATRNVDEMEGRCSGTIQQILRGSGLERREQIPKLTEARYSSDSDHQVRRVYDGVGPAARIDFYSRNGALWLSTASQGKAERLNGYLQISVPVGGKETGYSIDKNCKVTRVFHHEKRGPNYRMGVWTPDGWVWSGSSIGEDMRWSGLDTSLCDDLETGKIYVETRNYELRRELSNGKNRNEGLVSTVKQELGHGSYRERARIFAAQEAELKKACGIVKGLIP